MTTPPHVERVLAKPAVRACLTKGQAPNWIGRCPAHADERESLSFVLHEDGRLGVTCFAGCEPGAVLAALGLTVGDLDVPLTLETFARARSPRAG